MKRSSNKALDQMWSRHSDEWRDPAQICSHWREADSVNPDLLRAKITGAWWPTVERLGVTLLVTREYEHLVIAISTRNGQPHMSFLPLPHPSGLCVDRDRAKIFIASTRNPNQVFEFRPAIARDGAGSNSSASADQPLVPVRSTFYPGCLYLHDLALINGVLHGNAVGYNAVTRLEPNGSFKLVWWPRCIERNGSFAFGCNYIQLNSISGGRSVHDCYYSASADVISHLRPGHLKYPVDRRGVVFSGKTREPICRDLTRPHSVRLHNRHVWVNNSGYGEFGHVDGGRLKVVQRFGSWTRGLSLIDDVAFVGLSRVIPRFARYAPGLKVATARCGVAAVSLRSGEVLGSMEWPIGNQVFAIDWIDRRASLGFPFYVRQRRQRLEPSLFYRYSIDD